MVARRRGQVAGGGALWLSGRRPRDRAQGGGRRPGRAGAGAGATGPAGPDAGAGRPACPAGGAAHRTGARQGRTGARRAAARRQLRERRKRRAAARHRRRSGCAPAGCGGPGQTRRAIRSGYQLLKADTRRHRDGGRCRGGAGGGAGPDGGQGRAGRRRRSPRQRARTGPGARPRRPGVDGDAGGAARAAMAGELARTFAGRGPRVANLCGAPFAGRRHRRRRAGHERHRHGTRPAP